MLLVSMRTQREPSFWCNKLTCELQCKGTQCNHILPTHAGGQVGSIGLFLCAPIQAVEGCGMTAMLLPGFV